MERGSYICVWKYCEIGVEDSCVYMYSVLYFVVLALNTVPKHHKESHYDLK
jgi:hypothetical protein